jgi:DNA primase
LERLKNAKTPEEKQQRLIHYKLFTNKLDSLTPAQIERAKQYPLKDLLGTNKNIINCPFHDDRTASLNIKNNFYHCHGCGVSGDTIKFLMEKENLSFKEAVIKLQ